MKTIVVAGLGRCGTTLAMSMLSAAGVPTVGSAPDFEEIEHADLLARDPAAWLAEGQGKAFKLLDAHRFNLPDMGDADVLFLVRDPVEQAKSHLKLLNSMFTTIPNNRESVMRMAKGIRRDTPKALAKMRKATSKRVLVLGFEQMVKRPSYSAKLLCETFGLPNFCPSKMADLVDKRSPDCLPYLREAMALAA